MAEKEGKSKAAFRCAMHLLLLEYTRKLCVSALAPRGSKQKDLGCNPRNEGMAATDELSE